jgi:hypothetical protein
MATLAMVQKYAHLAAEHLTPYAERVAFGAGVTSQIRHSDVKPGLQEVA